jgi:hypothetical protein
VASNVFCVDKDTVVSQEVAAAAPEPIDKPLPLLTVMFVTARTPDRIKDIPRSARVITAKTPLLLLRLITNTAVFYYHCATN